MNKYLEKIKKETNLIKSLLRSRSASNGMTYVELIVVLSIFAVMSSLTMFNYGSFQGKVNIKNLSSDIALKIVQAQKASLSGQLNSHNYISEWKPSYGLYFTLLSDGLADSKSFNYFSDKDNNKAYDDSTCVPGNLNTECLEKISITRGGFISGISVFYQDTTTQALNEIIMIFTRPNSAPVFKSRSTLNSDISYVQITITSLGAGMTSTIQIYASGRIQVN